MKVTEKISSMPSKVKKQLQTALLLACAIATFVGPAFGGGYNILKEEKVVSSAAAIEDIYLPTLGASAYYEAKKIMNVNSDEEEKQRFLDNTAALVGSKWQNLGLLIGAKDALSGSTMDSYLNQLSLSVGEIQTYGNDALTDAYNQYKAFGFAMQNLRANALKSETASESVEDGLNAMSSAAIRLGSFGVEFLNDYNPGPVLLAFYDFNFLGQYRNNKLVQIVNNNDVLYNIIGLFGSPVAGTGFSFFVLINAVFAIVGFALSLILTLMGNRSIGEGFRHFIVRVLIGTVGIYIIANVMSIGLGWVKDTILDVSVSEESSYVEENLNLYDWYMTGFQLPSGTTLTIDSSGNFVFDRQIVRAINEYTYRRLVTSMTGEEPSDEAIKARMESFTQNGNQGTIGFVTPTMKSSSNEEAAWATDVYYAIMGNYAENKELLDGNDDPESPLYEMTSFNIYKSRYLYMSSLRMTYDRNTGSWSVYSYTSSNTYYGLNPISALNLMRTEFTGEAITATSVAYPPIAYVAFDCVNNYTTAASTHMNSITRFIASFTLVLAAMKGLITIFTAGFGGMFAGGVKTALGSSQGLGQALGGVAALLLGIIGISVIMSMTLSLLDTVYGISVSLVGDSEIITAFLEPLQESLGKIPVIGKAIMKAARGITEAILTLILALTFPKLGGIPITVFAQFMADLPGRMAEKAQMIEGMLMSGRSSAGGGLPGGGRGSTGRYGQMARQMGSKAFSDSTKQAGQVIKAGAQAAGALAGASLATAGRALNKKADNLEGKPSNVGISNWDDLSPEQQAKASEVAANNPDWANMSEDARQDALKQAGVFGEGGAETGTPNTEQTIKDGPAEQEVESINNGKESEEPVTESSELENSGDPQIPEPGEEMSMNQQTEPPVEGEPTEISDGTMPGEESSMNGEGTESPITAGGASDGTMPGQESSMNGEGTENPVTETETPDGTMPGEESSIGTQQSTEGTQQSAGEGDTLNVTESNNLEGGNQQFDTTVEQKNNMDALNVDQSRQLNTDIADQKDISSVDGRSTNNTANVSNAAGGVSQGGKGATPAAAGLNTGAAGTAPQAGSGKGLPTNSNSQKTSSAGQQSGASATYRSVNNTSQTGGNATQNVSTRAQQNVQFNTGADQSRTVNNTAGGQQMQSQTKTPGTGQSLEHGNSQQARKAADGGASSQSMNGTAKSKWGKEMTIKEQKQARAMHAVGDALQMMGGNRTIGQGVKDALGHAAEATVAYTVSPEITTQFAQDIRNRRMMRQELRRDARKNNKK